MFTKIPVTMVLASLLFGLVGPMTALAASPSAVSLGSAGNFVILAKTGISTTGSTSVTGDIGLSPAAASYITGFGLILPAAGAYSTSALITGKVYASDYASPTSANLTTAILDMQTAYTDAAGRAPTVTELGAGNIGGLTLAPGVYKWGTGVTIPTNVTLSGNSSDVWIFQIAQTLTIASGVHVTLTGGAQAANVFWVVAGQTTVGTTAAVSGNILDQTAIVFNTGATLTGRMLAQTAVTLDSNAVTSPSGSSSVSTPVPTPTPTPVSNTGSGSGSTSVVTPTTSQTSTQTTMTTTSTQTASSDTTNGLRIQLNALLATLQTLQARAAGSKSAIAMVAINLGTGSRDINVTTLQQFLISQNKGSAAHALASAGATGYFGSLTRAALAEFQTSVGISPALGNFGPITRQYLSTH
jgi:hypothetical protein